MTIHLKIATIYFIAINSLAYGMMCYDKYQSKKKAQRISENTLLLLAIVLGACGIYMGMKTPLYHKAAKPKFKFGIPFCIILNGLCIYFMSLLII